MDIYDGSLNAVRFGSGYAYPIQHYSNSRLEPIPPIPSYTSDVSAKDSGVNISISDEARMSYEKELALNESQMRTKDSLDFVTSDVQSYEDTAFVETHLPSSVPNPGLYLNILV